MRARLSDLARQAQVSEATVSRVLNDKPGVAPETREAVLAALDALGYERPARLRRRGGGLVGLVVPELNNPIFPTFAQTIESALAQYGYTLHVHPDAGGVTEDEYVEMLLDASGASVRLGCTPIPPATTALPGLVARQLRSCWSRRRRRAAAPFISPASTPRPAGRSHLAALGHRRSG